jgi:hypothetical protein
MVAQKERQFEGVVVQGPFKWKRTNQPQIRTYEALRFYLLLTPPSPGLTPF